MSMPAQPGPNGSAQRIGLSLSLLCVAAPSLWLGLLSSLYVLSDRHCERGSGPLWALLAVGSLISAGLTSASVRLWRRQRAPSVLPTPHVQRIRFQILLGLLLNVLSTLLCLGFAAPLAALRPCQ